MVLHGVGVGNGVRDVLEEILGLHLAVDAQTEDAVLGQVHVGFLEVLLLHVRVEDHLEVASLQQVRLILLRLDQRIVPISRPGSRQHVQEPQCTLRVLIQEVGDDILILLGPFDGEKVAHAAV